MSFMSVSKWVWKSGGAAKHTHTQEQTVTDFQSDDRTYYVKTYQGALTLSVLTCPARS